MSRHISTLCNTLILATGLLASVSFAQRDFSGVEISTEAVADNIYVLYGAGGNIGFSVHDEGVIMIDTQFAPLSERIKAAVAGHTSQNIQYVINTHWHGDHTDGNLNFVNDGAQIIAHERTRERLSEDFYLELFDTTYRALPEAALPGITFNDELSIERAGETIHMFHIPKAHTDTDIVIHYRNANVIHMGDLLWTVGYPRIDAGEGGGSVQGMIEAANIVMALADDNTQLISGHGPIPPRGTAFLREFRDMMQGIQDVVAGMIADGMNEQQVIAARPTAAFDERWAQGSFISPDLFARMVYISLTE